MKLFSFKVKSITTGNEKLRESQIEIAQVTKKDEGIYKCEASNTYGSGVTRMAKVTVVERTTVKVIFTIKSYLVVGSLASEFRGWSWKTHVGIPIGAEEQ